MAEKEKEQKKPAKPQGEKRGKKKAEGAAVETATAEDLKAPAPPARLYQRFKAEIVPALKEKYGEKNVMAVPRIEKVVISMGLGRHGTAGSEGKSKIDTAEKELTVITGQKPLRCKARKSVSNFKLREGMEIGLKVTLRGTRMYEFLDRMITLAIPRVKDFRGLDPSGFDKDGNYNFGFTEQTVFPEVNSAEITTPQGMNITLVTTAGNAERGRELLKLFGMPFREGGKGDK